MPADEVRVGSRRALPALALGGGLVGLVERQLSTVHNEQTHIDAGCPLPADSAFIYLPFARSYDNELYEMELVTEGA